MSSLARKQQQLVDRLLLIEDPTERLEAIVSRGRRWPAPAPADCTEVSLVRGCTSRVWIAMSVEFGKCRLLMQAEAPLVRGLAALLCELYDDESPADIASFYCELLDPLGLRDTISPQRAYGFSQIAARIRALSAAASA